MSQLSRLLTVAVLVPASLPSAGGWEAYPGFIENSMKHRATPLTNHMGLPTIASWHPYYAGRFVKQDGNDDPFLRWKQLRRETRDNRKILYWGVVIALFALMAWVVRGLEDWEATALSLGLAPALAFFRPRGGAFPDRSNRPVCRPLERARGLVGIGEAPPLVA